MRPQTKDLAARVRSMPTADTQLAELAGMYEGETAYVLSCGPSIADVWSDRLAAFLTDKLVITLKHAFDLVPASADFHLFNRCRHKDYCYPPEAPIRLAVEFQPFPHQADIRLPFWYHTEQRWLHSVLFSRALDRWLLSRSSTRGWGPGLMLELGIYLPVHLGCRRVVFFGWDMNPLEPAHFTEQAVSQEQLEEHVVVSTALPQFIPELTRWFGSHGVDAFLCSPRSNIPLPQLPVDDLLAIPAAAPCFAAR